MSTLAALSQSVASNAGTFGRQAAVVAVAAGLAAGVGGPALASTAPAQASGANSAAVTAAPPASVTAPRAAQPQTAPVVAAISNAAAKPEPKVAVQSNNEAQVKAPATQAGPTAAAASTPTAAPDAHGGNGAIVAAAYSGIGTPYVWGGTSKTAGWDCSGFVQWAYAQAGISIPRVNQWGVMHPTSNPQPGDLVVQNGGSHVGIYVGNGQEVNALNPGQGTLLTAVAAVGTAQYYTMN